MDFEQVASQLVRATRGKRSQAAHSRRLGYRTNVVSDWEAGRRFPTAAGALRAAAVSGVDLAKAFAAFHPESAPTLCNAGDDDVAAWLEQLRGGTPIVEIAKRAGRSRFAVARWLSGESRPRLPDFLRLIHAITDRLSDWVAAVVPIERVPGLLDQHRARVASRLLALEHPWTEAILRLLDTRAFRALRAHRPGVFAEALGIDPLTEQQCLDRLLAAGIVTRRGKRYESAGPLTIDTRAPETRINRVKAHWARVAVGRLADPGPDDIFSYNVVSMSRIDFKRAQELHRAYFREIRALVAASEPEEVAALINVQLMTWAR